MLYRLNGIELEGATMGAALVACKAGAFSLAVGERDR